MNDRQALAFSEPQATAQGDVARYRRVERVRDGVLVSILTVNR